MAVAVVHLALSSAISLAKDPPAGAEPQEIYNKTMGGRQYWGDVLVFHQWRIQRNVFTGHHRLLDGDGYRHAWGTRETCAAALEEIKQRQQLPRMSGKAVVLVHGLFRSSASFEDWKTDIEQAGFVPISVDYPSTQVDIAEAATYLQSALSSMEGIDEVNFVTHSLGGLVVRAALANHVDPRVKRIVFIGVPNTGAHLANLVEGNPIWRVIAGPAGQQLVTDKDGIIASLPPPACEFAVIAGGRGNNKGFHPLVPGDDDGTVAVASTQLPGAKDFSVVHGMHTFLPANDDVRRQTMSFLQYGRLREP